MVEELAVLCCGQSEFEVQTYCSALDDAAIPVIVRRAQLPGYPGSLEVYAGHYATLLVHATDRYRAGRVIEDWQELFAAPSCQARQEGQPRQRSRLSQSWGNALTALVMLAAWPALLVDDLLRGRSGLRDGGIRPDRLEEPEVLSQ
jgi:hypothetical protein